MGSIKRADSMADGMPEALKQSRYHMKRCFSRCVEKGKRIMKRHQLMDEINVVIQDKAERSQVLEGTLGYIFSSTQVYVYY